MITCRTCKTPEGLRVAKQEGAYGTLMVPYCEVCYAKDCAERRKEARLFGDRVSLKTWAKLIPVADAPWVDA